MKPIKSKGVLVGIALSLFLLFGSAAFLFAACSPCPPLSLEVSSAGCCAGECPSHLTQQAQQEGSAVSATPSAPSNLFTGVASFVEPNPVGVQLPQTERDGRYDTVARYTLYTTYLL